MCLENGDFHMNVVILKGKGDPIRISVLLSMKVSKNARARAKQIRNTKYDFFDMC